MEVRQAKLSRAKLAAMPQNERAVLLLLAHAANEINVLSKLIMMMRKEEPDSVIVDHVEAGQVFILMRLLIGKLHEAWVLFTSRVQGDERIRTKYLTTLSEPAVAALRQLNKHFGRSSALSTIRNKVAFHYTDKDDLTEKNFWQMPEGEEFQFYLCKTLSNSFYHAAELVAQSTAISLAIASTKPSTSTSSEAQGMKLLCHEIVQASRYVAELFGELVAILAVEAVTNVVVSDVPAQKLSEFLLPFFFDEEDLIKYART
jgi:hypothetical protein